MNILVTGGAGFVGSNYVRSALDGRFAGPEPTRLVVLDKLTYAGNWENLADHAADRRLELAVGDVCDPSEVAGAMTGIDLVVHFAAESHVDRSIHGGIEFVRTNALGTQTVLESALEAGVSRLVHVSTDEVYGSIERGSWDESEPVRPNSPYSASKASSDLIARAFHHTHRLDLSITRASNNYGPRQAPEKLVPLFLTNLLDDKPVPLYGDGLHVRDWLHVDDHCRAIDLVAETGQPGEVYNISGCAEFTNREITEQLLVITGRDHEYVKTVDDRKGHDRRYSVDASKIRRELGYVPLMEFEDGLARTVDWYRNNRCWWESDAA